MGLGSAANIGVQPGTQLLLLCRTTGGAWAGRRRTRGYDAIIANQLGRSATSVMANHAERTRASRTADTIAKQGICLQELQETHAWLSLLKLRNDRDLATCDTPLKEPDELIDLFVTSIKRLSRQ